MKRPAWPLHQSSGTQPPNPDRGLWPQPRHAPCSCLSEVTNFGQNQLSTANCAIRSRFHAAASRSSTTLMPRSSHFSIHSRKTYKRNRGCGWAAGLLFYPQPGSQSAAQTCTLQQTPSATRLGVSVTDGVVQGLQLFQFNFLQGNVGAWFQRSRSKPDAQTRKHTLTHSHSHSVTHTHTRTPAHRIWMPL